MVTKQKPATTDPKGERPVRRVKRKVRKQALAMPATKLASVGTVKISGIREGLGLTRRVFSRLCGYSERALAEWEAGKPLSDSSRQRMIEMDRLRKALARVMKSDFIGPWLQTPNDAFDGLKPLEVVERGELDRIWQMIYMLESGQPS